MRSWSAGWWWPSPWVSQSKQCSAVLSRNDAQQRVQLPHCSSLFFHFVRVLTVCFAAPSRCRPAGVHSGNTDVPNKGLASLPVFNTLLPTFLNAAQPHHIYR